MIEKLVIFGDSISTPLIGDGGYAALLRELLQPKELCNFAVAASGTSLVTPDNLLGVLQNHADDCNNADVIILWHGTNDWYWGSPVGQLGSFNDQTYIGALEKAITTIREHAPNALLVTATPLFRLQAPDGSETVGDAWFTKNKVGATLSDYEKALRDTAKAYCVPVVDARALTGFCAQNRTRFQPDDIHPGKEGCDILARIFAEHIKRFLSYKTI